SEVLYRRLRPVLMELLPDDRGYEGCFDVFEYLCALVFIDMQRSRPDPVGWYPPGRFFWRWSVVDKLNEESGEAGPEWPPLQAGLLGGSLKRLKAAQEALRRPTW